MDQIGPGPVSRFKGEEGSLIRPPLEPSNARPRWSGIREHLRNWKYIRILFLFALVCSLNARALFQGHSHDHALNEGPNPESAELWTEWLDITPSEKLKWQPCFGIYGPNFHCARLTVPMDYSRPLNESANHPKVHLALIMAAGAGRTQDPSTYAEAPLLINPGGPGGSGVVLAQMRANGLQLLVGDQHDIIGFDPRGVGASTPKADCFASPNSPNGVSGRNVAYMNRLTWVTGGQGAGLTNSSNVALTMLNARARTMAELCQRVDESEGDGSIFRHMSTPNSARDMLSIIHAWDEWRSSSRIIQPVQSEAIHPLREHQNSNDHKKSQASLQGKLVYWGFSYGTFLGATFASMFPDKVGRLVLDGVVHADRYVNPTWEGSTADADAIWDRFFVYCAEAGALCNFYRTGDRPEDIRNRFSETLSLLEKQPATVILPDINLPALVTASDMKKSIFFAGLYAPIVGFPLIAELLDHAFNGRLGDIAQGAGMVTLCSNITLPLWPDDAMRGIACSDKRYKLNENVTGLQDRFEKAASYSWFADVWFGTEPNLGCNGWEIKSKEPPMRWDDHPAHKPALIETNFPILFISNTLDPVTPLGHALEMTRKFANASIVEQDGIGHCSLSCISGCTVEHVRAYLNEGILPPPPKFKSDSGNEGEWPTCKCFDRPWTSLGYEADEALSRLQVNGIHKQAYEELRAHFSAFTLSQQLDHSNPLKAYLVERSGRAASYP
ncbi:Alpha/Beta hydrolase protein [Xylaria sp. FL1777]|nr:Alpha/Beta hydrolase protein [Xylaria sp. FL1777]